MHHDARRSNRQAGLGTMNPPSDSGGGKLPELVIEKLLTTKEVADLLVLSPKVVERKAQRGEIPGFKVGKFWRYRQSMLDSWIDSQLQSARQACCKETSF
jgi:excisionase family DNA binding protein